MILPICLGLMAFTFHKTKGSVAVEVEDSVQGGAYMYFNLSTPEAVYLKLKSTEGDCDIYVSHESVFPTYKEYSLHSATCGDDAVFIAKHTKRPVYIGVYGHPSYETSHCSMSVCIFDNVDSLDDVSDLLELPDTTIEESCLQDTQRSNHYFANLKVILDIFSSFHLDSIIFELLAEVAQAVI